MCYCLCTPHHEKGKAELAVLTDCPPNSILLGSRQVDSKHSNNRPVDALLQEEAEAELAVLTDRAQGGASLSSGQLEVMLQDDNKAAAVDLTEEPLMIDCSQQTN